MSSKRFQALLSGPGPSGRGRLASALSVLFGLVVLLTTLTLLGNLALGLSQQGYLRAPAAVAMTVVVTFFAGQIWRGWVERQRIRAAAQRMRETLLRLREQGQRQRCATE